ncbi:uncharacterized protein [Solanum lycopersicum]|uniref:Uncharacterized protein n=1 Tax=Solanum lycopersicum TaxID=4081 RepID=A0A3Q7FCJ1_SOLLC|nr:uncharacterized protein LOC101249214 [Solanum lycopersicum]
MAKFLFIVISCFFFLAFQKGNQALTVTYTVTNRDPNSSGGIRFTNEVGINYTKQTLANSTNFIWAIFQQTADADKKQYTALNAFVENTTNGYIAYTVGNEIHLGTSYIQSYSGNIKTELTGILFHEATHVWQWFGNSSTPGGLIEGIADYVRLKAGYVVSNWAKNGQGTRWDEGYSVTARFLDYCNGLRNGFVAELNKKMRSGYSNNFFVELLGKTPDQLFVDYKAKYNNTA